MTPKDKKQSPVEIMSKIIVAIGMMATGILLLKDRKNRDRIKNLLSRTKDEAGEQMENFQKEVKTRKDELASELEKGKEKIENKLNYTADKYES